MKRILLIVVILLTGLVTKATHLVGGYLYYTCNSGNSYTLTVKLYRDCGGVPLPGSISITIRTGANALIQTVNASLGSTVNVPIPTTNPCLIPPSNVCVQEGTYQVTVTLGTSSTGYHIYYQDCCRNNAVTNITNSGNVGMTLHAKIPNPATYPCNSAPTFTNVPPIAVCLNQPITYNHSATDPNADSLAYYLCPAYNNAPGQYPFNNVPYVNPPYSGAYPMASSPALAIHPVTGLLTGTPSSLGRFVVTICIREYRNGVLLGEYRREVQFNVVNCTQSVTASINSSAGVITSCDSYTVGFGNNSSGATNYFWDFGVPGTNADTSNLTNPVFTYPDTGTYTVMLIANPGVICADTAFATVIVYPLLDPNFGYTGNLCAGMPISFIDSTTNTYGNITSWAWNFGNGNTSNMQNPSNIFNSSGNYNVRLIVTTSTGCIDTIYKLLYISPAPTANAGPDKNICIGASAVLNGSGTGTGLTYSWSPATGLSCTNCPNPTASPTSTTAYTLTVTSSTGCVATDVVNVNIIPYPNVNAGADKYICPGGSAPLFVIVSNVSGGYTLQWTPTTWLSSSLILNPTATPPTTTSYIITITNSSGCSNSDTVTVYVNQPTVNAGNTVNICLNDTAQLNAVASTGVVSYSWSPAATLSNPSIQNPKAWPAVSTTYTVTVTDNGNCTATDTVRVVVNQPSNIDAGTDTAICSGSSATLNPSGGVTYVWDPDPTLSCTNCPAPVATPLATKTYYVVGTDAIGCSNRDSVTVTVNPLPTISVTPSDTICSFAPKQLNASGGVSYSWSPATGLSCSSCPNPVATLSSTTTYTVTGTDANGCQNSATVTITIIPPPTVTTGPAKIICEGDTTSLFASGGISYSWSPATGLSCTNCPNPVANPLVTTTYTVTVTDAIGCQNTGSQIVTVNSLASGNFISDTSLCIGSSIQLYATGFATYQWSPASSLSCTTCPTPTATPTTTTTYTVAVADNNGCQDTGTVNVVVHNLPIVNTTPDVSICIGSNTSLSAYGGVTYQWAPSSGLSCTNCQTTSASPLTTTTYTVTATDANGCQNTATVTVTVLPLPTVTKSPDVAICEGDSTQLNAAGGVSYLWIPSTGLSCNTCPNPIAFPMVSTTYIVRVTDGNGCVNYDSVKVTVNSLASGNIISDTSLCIGSSIQLYATGFVTYTWSPGASLSCTNCPSPTATPSSTTVYTLQVADNNGCTDVDSVEVIVHPLPTVVTSQDDTICIGSSTILTASGGVSYSWAPSTGLSCTSCPNPVASPNSTTTYTVTVTDGNTCVNTGNVTVTVMPLPTITKSPNTQVCVGDSTQLSVSGGINYSWNPSSSLTCNTCPNPFAFPVLTTVYTVQVTDQYGCVNSDSITVNVNAAAGNISPDTDICIGSSTTLSISGGVSYLWGPSAGLSCLTCTNPVASPLTTTTYSVAVLDINGCRDTGYVTVTVNPLPTVTISPNVTICAGNSTQLNASGGVSYSWLPTTGLSCTSCPNPIASPATTTNYTVTVTDAKGCVDTGQVEVKVNPLPTTNAGNDVSICYGFSTQLNATGAAAYQWSPPTGLSATSISNPLASPLSTITYTVVGTHANGCTKSDSVTVTVNALPVVTVSPDANICIGDNVQLSASGGTSYQWSPSTGLSAANIANPVATPAITTTYTVIAFNAAGCQAVDSVSITVNGPANTTITADTGICPGQTVQLNATGGVSYQWSPPTDLSSTTIANPVSTPASTITYSLLIIDVNGCRINESTTITVNTPADPLAGVDTSICPGETAQLSASNGVSYVWSPQADLDDPFTANPLASPSVATIYTVSIIDNNGCSNTGTVSVSLFPAPTIGAGQDKTIYAGQGLVLEATGGINYTWSPATYLDDPTKQNPVSFPSETIIYYLVGIDANGCYGYDSVIITVQPLPTLYMPSAFSPNNDGENDLFIVKYTKNFIISSIKVFNRWGEMVFSTNDDSRGWDGTFNGSPQPMGSYIYFIEGHDVDGVPLSRKGNVTLIR